MFKNKRLLLLTLMLSVVLVASGCIRSIPTNPNTPGPGTGEVSVSGIVSLESGLPLYEAEVTLGHETVTTNGYGHFVFHDVKSGQYDLKVKTRINSWTGKVSVEDKDVTVNVEIADPAEYRNDVFAGVSNVKNGIKRWPSDSHIKYYISGVSGTQEEKFKSKVEDAMITWIRSTGLDDALTFSEVTSRIDANVIIDVVSDLGSMVKVLPTVNSGEIRFVEIQFIKDNTYIDANLPYHVMVAQMLGLVGETTIDEGSVLWHKPESKHLSKTPSTRDKANIRVLYSLEPGFKSDVQSK